MNIESHKMFGKSLHDLGKKMKNDKNKICIFV